MDKVQALDVFNTIAHNWDDERDPKYKTGWIDSAKEALETLTTLHDKAISEANGRLISSVLKRLADMRDELDVIVTDCAMIPYYGRVHELTEESKAAIERVIYEVSPCLKPSQEKPKARRYVMQICFNTIPKMGDGTETQCSYFDELSKRHGVKIDCTGTNDADIYYNEREKADAVLNEMHNDNAGPRIDTGR